MVIVASTGEEYLVVLDAADTGDVAEDSAGRRKLIQQSAKVAQVARPMRKAFFRVADRGTRSMRNSKPNFSAVFLAAITDQSQKEISLSQKYL